jgi:hypothetical protein
METGKIALAAGAIVAALATLGFAIYRSNSASGTVASGPVRHVTAAAREKRTPASQYGGAPGQYQPGTAALRWRGRPAQQPGSGY